MEKIAGGRIAYVRLFSVIAFLILIIACINFMNLATAKTTARIREAGIRKLVGARRGSLIIRYITESTFIALLSLLDVGYNYSNSITAAVQAYHAKRASSFF